MFDFVRTHKRILFLFLVIVIFPSFVLFGVEGYRQFNAGPGREVAEVDGQPIKQPEFDEAHRRQLEAMRERAPQVDAKMFDTPQARQQTLDGLVRDRVAAAAANKLHLDAAVSDERILRIFTSDPQFAQIRNPDGTVNKDFLAMQGMSSEMFVQRLKRDLANQQVFTGVTATGLLSNAGADTAIDALLQQREVAIKRFDASAYVERAKPADADIELYYKANPARFRMREQATIEYLVFDLPAVEKTISVSADDARKLYGDNPKRFTVPEERRTSHILITADKDAPAADKEKAKAKAQAILDELRKKPDAFAEIAKTRSDDKISAAQGGDLDFNGRGGMISPAFEDAAFALKAGEISNLVETEFGYHIIKLTAARGGERKPFDEVKGELEAELRKQAAQQKFAEASEKFSNTVYTKADSLQAAIDEFKLEKKTATVQRQPAPGATGPLASPKLLDALFAPDSIASKRNTEAIDVGPNQLVSARVLTHSPERLPPLAEVRDQVVASVKASQAAELARKDGKALLDTLKAGGEMADAKPVVVSRLQPQGLPREVVMEAMKLDVTKGPVASGVDLAGVGYVVLRVSKVVPREANDEQAKQIQPLLGQALAAAEAEAYYEALKTRFKVKTFDLAKPAEN
jgi:peptidyl-prolyl cis-trans isomerase D